MWTNKRSLLFNVSFLSVLLVCCWSFGLITRLYQDKSNYYNSILVTFDTKLFRAETSFLEHIREEIDTLKRLKRIP